MQPLPALDRRALLCAGAAAFGTLALGLPPASAAPAGAVILGPEGALLAWVRLRRDGGAEVRIVHAEGGALRGQAAVVTLAPAALDGAEGRASAWGRLRAASARAQDRAVLVAAAAWGVTAAECAVGPGRIAHAPSGRSVGYALWADPA